MPVHVLQIFLLKFCKVFVTVLALRFLSLESELVVTVFLKFLLLDTASDKKCQL